MSAICGVVRLDGGPPDARRVDRMTSWLARRAPDGSSTWSGPRAAFGHALLDTADGKLGDRQPCTLDARRWIVADARIDARAELVAALAAVGDIVDPAATDAQLILHAWRAWGEACVDRLIGDFAFALWDEDRRTLFCARDHLGVKPFFHAQGDGTFVFCSSLAGLRREGGVPDTLDELAIADFLLFEMSQEPGATVFAAIRRLPPAHCLTLTPGALVIRRYWRLPPAELPRPRRDEECLEEFGELLGRAVADRTRSSRAAVLMSGGLDSPAVASLAVQRGIDVRAFSSVYDRLMPDEERHYSSLAARHIGIPIAHQAADGYKLFERYADLAFHFPEPLNAPFAAADLDLAADAANHARVALTGWDGDTLLNEAAGPYLRALASRGRWLELGRSAARYAMDHPRSAMRSAALRLRPRSRPAGTSTSLPPWLDADFEARLRLRERWADAMNAPVLPHPIRPLAHRTFDLMGRLASFFEAWDPSRTGSLVEMRHPIFDLRVIAFCMSLPTVPWCVRKEILRRWLRGRVPEAVRLRPKTPLAKSPHLVAPRLPPHVFCGGASAFVDQGKMDSPGMQQDPAAAWVDLRPIALDLWLRHARTA